MNEPWFRRFGVIGYLPIHRNGTLVILGMLTAATPLCLVFVAFAEDYPVAAWACGLTAMLVMAIGHALVFTHMEDSTRE
jgi:hypothetical protein